MAEGIGISAATQDDRPWIRSLLESRWGEVEIVTRGNLHRAEDLPAFVARLDNKRVGLATYRIDEGDCEIVTLDSLRWGCGVGTALVEAVRQEARAEKCSRLWLITTNDNLESLRFYQKRGFNLARLHPGALAESRRIKPSIPTIGKHRIPMRDEIELEMSL